MSGSYLGQHLRDVLVGHVRLFAQDCFDLHEVERFSGHQLVGELLDQLLLLCQDRFAPGQLFDDDLDFLLVGELREKCVLFQSSG